MALRFGHACGLALILLSCASPAQARRFFIPIPHFGGGSNAETIDLVEDLPNTAAFKREDGYYDLGYLRGSSNRYVLYHGNAYLKMSESDVQAYLIAKLGRDPIEQNDAKTPGGRSLSKNRKIAKGLADGTITQTKAARMRAEMKADTMVATGEWSAEEKAYRIESETLGHAYRNGEISKDEMLKRLRALKPRRKPAGAAPDAAAPAASSQGSGAVTITLLLALVIAGAFGLKKFLTRNAGARPEANDDHHPAAMASDEDRYESADARIAARLAELAAAKQAPAAPSAPYDPRTMPDRRAVPRGFGKKVA